VSDSFEQRGVLIRELRQRLEALERAGIDRIPAPVLPALTVVASRAESIAGPELDPERPSSPAPADRRPASSRDRSFPAPPPPGALGGSLFDVVTSDEPEASVEERTQKLGDLRTEVAACERCPILVANRTQTVFGEGNPAARLMFVGEAPGETEDRTGRPFVGRAGQLLTDMITKGMGIKREDVYIANILKSRPPENRDPLPEETRNCMPFLERQIAIIRPAFLCLLGSPAAKALLNTSMGVTRLRGKWHRYQGIPTVVTFHPSYLLRTPSAKKDAWEDLQMLMSAMGIRAPDRLRD
jgi:uracil-DNA glycosylase